MTGWFNNSSETPNGANTQGPQVGVTTWGLQLRHGGFAMLNLGAAGWLALLSPGVVIGLLIARLSDNSFIIFGIVGGIVIWLAAVGIERAFAGNQMARFSIEPSLSADELDATLEAARHAGIKFDHSFEDDASRFETKAKYMARLHNIVRVARS